MGWGLLIAASLIAWTVAAIAAARRLPLSEATLRLEAWIAAGVTVSMAVMTAATAIWWAALAHAAPWFLAGQPAGVEASPLAPKLLAASVLMLVATEVAVLGAARALRILPTLAGRQSS